MLEQIDSNGNKLVRGIVRPDAAVTTHRTNVAAADGTAAPAVDNAAWLVNPGGANTCLLFCYLTFTNGTSPSAVIRPHLRAGGATGKVGGIEPVTIVGSAQRVIAVQACGLDVLCWLESIAGTPDATDLDITAVWL